MKKLILIFLICLFSSNVQTDEVVVINAGVVTPFVFTILTLEANDTFTLPLYNGGTYNFIVDWGDLSQSTITTYDDADNPHTYADAGASTYIITITGVINGWKFDNAGDKALMKDISQWGCFQPGNTGDTFKGCSNLTVSATDRMNLSGVTDMNEMFQLCSKLTTIPNIGTWDVSKVTTFYGMFHSDVLFNQSLSGWTTSAVTNTGYMFYSCAAFNGDISTWDMADVTIASYMFYNAAAFNQNISGWVTSSLTNVGSMFHGAEAFNQNISGWDVADVADFSSMFVGAIAFNQNISGWNMTGSTNFYHMFDGATSFDQNLAAWDITSVTAMVEMFDGVTLSTANYSAILIGWEGQVEQAGVIFDGGNSKYSAGAAATARAALVTNTWTITDGGLEE